MLLLRDGKQQLSVVRNQANGVTSLASGSAEIMLARRCAEKDGIPLNDSLVVNTSMWLALEDLEDAAITQRRQPVLAGNPAVPLFGAGAAGTRAQWLAAAAMASGSALAQALPANVHLLTLERWQPGQVLLRLQHLFAVGEHPTWSQPATVDLSKLFNAKFLAPINMTETILSGLAPRSPQPTFPVITLDPMTIRTFVLRV